MTRNSKSTQSAKTTKPLKAQPVTAPNPTIRSSYPIVDDFFDYDWKSIPKRHAFAVFALCLYANLPDYREVATESLTEGGDDKDCDLCLIDAEVWEQVTKCSPAVKRENAWQWV